MSASPAQRQQRSRESHIREHGLTVQEYDAMLARQHGLCAVPGCTHPATRIDHDHQCCPGRWSCGKCVRGLLCNACNTKGVWDADWRAQQRAARRAAAAEVDRRWEAAHPELPPLLPLDYPQ